MSLWNDVKGLLGAVAPTIGTAIAGPLGGLAGRALSDALGLPTGSKDADVVKALQNATPDQLLAIRKADQEFQVRMQELGIEAEKLVNDDRASARAREAAVKDKTPMVLALLVTMGFFGCLGYMLTNGAPQEGKDALLIMLGSLGTAWTGVIAYYFGSSASSRAKDAALAKAINQ